MDPTHLISLAYLAAPYTDSDKNVVEERMRQLCIADAALMKKDILTASPLLKHFLLAHTPLPGDWAYWSKYSAVLLSRCDTMIVIQLDGWKDSVGVQAEIALAIKMDIPIYYCTTENVDGFSFKDPKFLKPAE